MFEAGVVLFFRHMAPDGQLARAIIPNGRMVAINDDGTHSDDYVVYDAKNEPLGFFPRDWIAAILPLETTGPSDAVDQSSGRSDTSSPTQGNSKGFLGGIKRFDSGE